MKTAVKYALHSMALACALAPAALAGFGRLPAVYLMFAQAFALVPGLPGDYLRVAFYCLTLRRCSMFSRIQFGSFCAHAAASIGRGVYIGSYCVLGRAAIGARTQIASGVQILSGRHQHARDAEGRILGAEQGEFAEVSIGADCWIGAAAIVMAPIGDGSTIGAGTVVVKPIPGGSVAVGNPARVIRSAEGVQGL